MMQPEDEFLLILAGAIAVLVIDWLFPSDIPERWW